MYIRSTVYMAKIDPLRYQPNLDGWPKKKIENNKQKQLRFLMPQTSGHTQVSQSQSSSSAHVPGQSQTLSFTNPRRSQSFFDMFCPNTNCCPKKYVLHSLSLPNPGTDW